MFCTHNLQTRPFYTYIINKYFIPERALNNVCKFFRLYLLFYTNIYYLVAPPGAIRWLIRISELISNASRFIVIQSEPWTQIAAIDSSYQSHHSFNSLDSDCTTQIYWYSHKITYMYYMVCISNRSFLMSPLENNTFRLQCNITIHKF